MIIGVDKIIVKERIRKDFGDIAELAADIRDNGLISPIVVNKDYVLLAGERRLRAVKQLGWPQVEVRMMDTRDAEHELNIEISENDVRKAFSKSERVDYMYRLMRIEKEKARERMTAGGQQIFAEGDKGQARDKTAAAFGVSGETMRKEMQIVENKDLLPPEDFADWDEGKLSTNKAYQQMKARMKQLEEENEKLHDDNKILARRSAQEPVIMEKPVEIVPEDYREVKSKAKAYDAETKRLNGKLEEAYRERNELEDKIRELQEQTAREQTNNDTVASAIYFIAQCGSFIRDVGGYVWLADKIAELPEREREGYIKAIMAVRDWSMVLIDNIERSEYGKSEVERISSKSGKE